MSEKKRRRIPVSQLPEQASPSSRAKPASQGRSASPAPSQPSPAAHDEHGGSSVLALGRLGVGIVVVVLLTVVLAVAVLQYYETRQRAAFTPGFAVGQNPMLPPDPLLVAAPAEAMQRYRLQEEEILHSYGWVDKDAGVVRIPIDRAIELLAQEGLPARE